MKADSRVYVRKHVCETDMSEEAIHRRFERLAGLYDLVCAFKHPKVKRVCESSGCYTARTKRPPSQAKPEPRHLKPNTPYA